MKYPTTLLLILFMYSFTSAQVYVWPTVDPYVPYHSVEYFENVKGYSKKVKADVINRNNEVYKDAGDKFLIALRQVYSSSCDNIHFKNTYTPLSDIRGSDDIFVDLSCGASIVKKDYPYYRTGNLNLSPEIFYQVKIYDASGNLLAEKRFTETIDYRKEIRDNLGEISTYEYDAEIFHQGLLVSFEGKALRDAISYLCTFYADLDKTKLSLDQENFKKNIRLLADQRRSEYPGYYTEFSLASSYTAPAGSGTVQYVSAETSTATVSPEMTDAFNRVREQSRNWALVIGVSEYQSSSVNDLPEPVKDAKELAAVLLTRYDFYPEEMLFLENPTREEIIESFDFLAGTVLPQDNLLIFFAGHGHWDKTLEKGYWIPSDATMQNRANWFSNSDLRDYISGIKSHHTLLITDACFGGGIFKTRDAFNEISPATFELYKLPSRKAMTSGAMTTVPDKSVFLDYLIKRLIENDQPFMSSEQLFASFKIAVINNSPTRQVPQFGEIREAGDEGGDFLFILK